MFFFFPMMNALTAPVATPLHAPKPLPMLPLSAKCARESCEDGFANAISYAAAFGNDVIRQAISSIASALTALGSRFSDFFSYIVAWLAFDRLARQASSMMAMGFQAFGLPAPQPSYPVLPAPFFPSSFASQPFAAAPGAGPFDPMTAFAHMAAPWMTLWAPKAAPAPAPQAAVPLTVKLAMPGFAWSMAIG